MGDWKGLFIAVLGYIIFAACSETWQSPLLDGVVLGAIVAVARIWK